jgi:hypothetical protein
MTQEELDAMLSDPDGLDSIDEEASQASESKNDFINTLDEKQKKAVANYRADPTESWPPPPPTADHKIVDQLDQVTRESEEKATEIFDNLSNISDDMMDTSGLIKHMQDRLDYFAGIMDMVNKKFPNIKTFKEMHEEIYSFKRGVEQLENVIMSVEDATMNAMDTMQFQDIHRQKIERVVNVMRALSRYMNDLLEGKIDDDKRVQTAAHIAGDTSTDDVMSNDDIEALIAQFGS